MIQAACGWPEVGRSPRLRSASSRVYASSGVRPLSDEWGRHRVLVPVAVDSPRRYTGAMNAIDERACGKPGCDNFGKPGLNIVGHGWFVTKSGHRRRYRCTVCGGTLSTNTGTAYRGLRCSRREFDQVASLRVEGVSISVTARVTGHSRTTIARWLERASTAAACFNHRLLRDFDVIELQADERCTFIGSKRRTLCTVPNWRNGCAIISSQPISPGVSMRPTFVSRTVGATSTEPSIPAAPRSTSCSRGGAMPLRPHACSARR